MFLMMELVFLCFSPFGCSFDLTFDVRCAILINTNYYKYLDEAYFRELNRRHIIMTGQPLNLAELTKRKPKKYIDNIRR